MAEKYPPYMLVWTGSSTEVQGLPKVMRRVLQNALTADRNDPAKFMVGMGRMLRYCDIGSPCRRRARLAAANILTDPHAIEACVRHSLDISMVFSRAFRAVRYREGHVWEDGSSPGLAIVTVRDDLESLWQAVRRGVPVPDLVRDQELNHALHALRNEIFDHIQTVDALRDSVVDKLVGDDLAGMPPGHGHDFLDGLSAVEPLQWWLAVYRSSIVRLPHRG